MSDYLNWDEGFYDDEPDKGEAFRRALDKMHEMAEEEKAKISEPPNSGEELAKLLDLIQGLIVNQNEVEDVKGLTINLNLDGGEKIRKEIQAIGNELLKATHYASELVETLERIKSI